MSIIWQYLRAPNLQKASQSLFRKPSVTKSRISCLNTFLIRECEASRCKSFWAVYTTEKRPFSIFQSLKTRTTTTFLIHVLEHDLLNRKRLLKFSCDFHMMIHFLVFQKSNTDHYFFSCLVFTYAGLHITFYLL